YAGRALASPGGGVMHRRSSYLSRERGNMLEKSLPAPGGGQYAGRALASPGGGVMHRRSLHLPRDVNT
ncbi:MAG TPA: hypothetical protein PKV77_04295, partial [Bacteroidales bacterium]|nr:hypothetical protein [Bacteroidales bacterium]